MKRNKTTAPPPKGTKSRKRGPRTGGVARTSKRGNGKRIN